MMQKIKKIETSSRKNKPKEIALEKNDERERNIGETKPQNITRPWKRDMYGMQQICWNRCAMWKYEYMDIDGIATNVKEQLRRKSRNCTQRKHTIYVKKTKTQSQYLSGQINMN